MAERNRVRVTVNPRIRALRELYKLTDRDMREIRDALDIEFTKQRKRTFATEGAAGGEKWDALSPAYAKWKQKKKPGRKIMQFSGKLRKSLVNRNDPGHVATYRKKPRPVVTLGTHNIVAAYHAPKHLAGALANPNVPVRDVMQHSNRQEAKLLKVLAAALSPKLDRVRRALAAWSRVGTGR
jgi:phage gpG-like protein